MIIDNYLRIITDARNIDIFDLVPDGGCESLKRLYLGKAWHPRKGIITRLVSFSYRYLNCVVKQLIIRKSRMPKGNVLFFVVSKNEKDALDPIFNVLHNSFMTNCNSEAENEFPFSFAYLISLFYIPWLLKKFRDSIGYRRMSFKYYIDFYLCTYGMYVVSRFFLKKYKPTAIIVSNDLSVWCRALCKAAVDEGIKTFYVQHASVSGDEPALIFNYALLEGFNALFKYNKSGMTKTKIFLIGMAKNDRYYKYINHSKIVRTIGICTNGTEPYKRVRDVCAYLTMELPAIAVVLRPHPFQRDIKKLRNLSLEYNIGFSDAKNELSFDFFRKVDVIIAGDSNILLEAVIGNIVPLYYDFDDLFLDYYGFVANKLADYFSKPEELYAYLKLIAENKPDVRHRGKSYSVAIGTVHDGHSSKLASTLIEGLTSTAKIDFEKWHRISNVDIEAYEPVC